MLRTGCPTTLMRPLLGMEAGSCLTLVRRSRNTRCCSFPKHSARYIIKNSLSQRSRDDGMRRKYLSFKSEGSMYLLGPRFHSGTRSWHMYLLDSRKTSRSVARDFDRTSSQSITTCHSQVMSVIQVMKTPFLWQERNKRPLKRQMLSARRK